VTAFLSSTMSTQIFSHEFLQAAPEREKQRILEERRRYSEEIVNVFIQDLQKLAIQGKTRFVYTQNPPAPLTYHELMVSFQRNFPESNVSYEETWVDVSATNRVLKKGIVIDWS
jgi:hypothetical protein